MYPFTIYRFYEFISNLLLSRIIHYPSKSARKASWNPAGVEPVHRKPADINPGSLKWVKISMYFSRKRMVQIKQKGVYWVENPLTRSFMGGVGIIFVLPIYCFYVSMLLIHHGYWYSHVSWRICIIYQSLQHTATHCNTLQHTATHCNTLRHTATHCNTLQNTATHRLERCTIPRLEKSKRTLTSTLQRMALCRRS